MYQHVCIFSASLQHCQIGARALREMKNFIELVILVSTQGKFFSLVRVQPCRLNFCFFLTKSLRQLRLVYKLYKLIYRQYNYKCNSICSVEYSRIGSI